MEIIPVEAGIILTNGYIFIGDSGKEGIIIDSPMDGSPEMLEIIQTKNLKIQAIFITHTHWDHTADVKKLHDALNVPVYCHAEDAYRMIAPMENSIFPLPFVLEPLFPDLCLTDNQNIPLGDLNIDVLHTPGHTEGGLCFVEHNHKVVFTGDTLFNGSIGRSDLPGGNSKSLMTSIKNKLLNLGDDYKVYCGHGQATTIGRERLYNPFLNDVFI